jgi:ABC-type sulfate transport system substrate-binding protein
MKKSEWDYLARAMWEYSEKHEGKTSRLLKELVKKIHNNMEVIIDGMDEFSETTTSNRKNETNTGSEDVFRGNGEF